MKKIVITLTIVAIFISANFAISQQEYTWEFEKLLVDFHLPQSNSYGIHAVVVDPNDNIWIGLHGIAPDTIFTAENDTIPLNIIYVLDADGNHVSFSPIKFITVNGEMDTLTSSLKCKGMNKDQNGNILFSAGGYALYRINYQTGEGMNKFIAPINSSLTEATCDANGNIYLGYVLGGDKPVHILDTDFNLIGNAIDTLGYINRTFEVTSDGKDLYSGSTWNGFGIVHYHSDIPGVLPFTAVDTLGNWDAVYDPVNDTTYYDVKLWASCLDWGPEGYLWAGNLRPDWSGPKGGMYYALDINTGKIVDSVGVAMGDSSNGGIYSPRGAAWSNDGSKMYLADYDYNIVGVWKKTAVGVAYVHNNVPLSFNLHQNYPNPFNPTTTITFTFTKKGFVELKVYDINGREVKTIISKQMDVGTHKVMFDASGLASGIYYYTLIHNGQKQTKQMVLVK